MFLDSLYCTEYVNDNEAQDVSFSVNFTKPKNNLDKFPIFIEQDLSWDEEELSNLLSKEEQNYLHEILLKSQSLAIARYEAVKWMLKVKEHYCFTALTAVLAVNYFDRFLCSFNFQAEKPWMTQLVAVACLSLAAKMEETHVPLLLDFQVEESRFVFEAKTIQRMEILVLSTLKWKMNPVTPLSFLDYVTRRLGLKDHLCCEFLRRCEIILVTIISDSRIMCYLPSVLAGAIMMQVVNGIEPSLGDQYQNQLSGILGIDKLWLTTIEQDKLEGCSKLVSGLESSDRCKLSKKRKYNSVPGTPNGVMDMSFSSDSSNDSWSVSSSPEPLTKKNRVEDDQLVQKLKHAASDVLKIQR